MTSQLNLALDRNQVLDTLITETLKGVRGPWQLNGNQAKLLARVARSRGAMMAVPVQTLADYIGVEARTVKAIVKELVEDFEIPIGASRGEPNGYYLIMTADEMRDAVRPYINEVRSLARRVKALAPNSRMAELLGQLTFEAEEDSWPAA